MTQKEVEFYFNKFVVDDIMGRLDEAEERIRKTKETLKKLLEMQGHINIKEDVQSVGLSSKDRRSQKMNSDNKDLGKEMADRMKKKYFDRFPDHKVAPNWVKDPRSFPIGFIIEGLLDIIGAEIEARCKENG
jgi:hypothetical protein